MKKKLAGVLVLIGFVVTTQAQEKTENLKITWPEEYRWKIATNQEDEKVHLIELIPYHEKIENWSIMGTMMSFKGVKGVPMNKAMNMMFDLASQQAPKAKITELEKDEKAVHPWILFKIESPRFKSDNHPESQLYYIVQGESSLYANFVAIKEKKISKEFISKWKPVFRAGRLENK
jgi:hypothetical protein